VNRKNRDAVASQAALNTCTNLSINVLQPQADAAAREPVKTDKVVTHGINQ
jgi:hypothetical protein